MPNYKVTIRETLEWRLRLKRRTEPKRNISCPDSTTKENISSTPTTIKVFSLRLKGQTEIGEKTSDERRFRGRGLVSITLSKHRVCNDKHRLLGSALIPLAPKTVCENANIQFRYTSMMRN